MESDKPVAHKLNNYSKRWMFPAGVAVVASVAAALAPARVSQLTRIFAAATLIGLTELAGTAWLLRSEKYKIGRVVNSKGAWEFDRYHLMRDKLMKSGTIVVIASSCLLTGICAFAKTSLTARQLIPFLGLTACAGWVVKYFSYRPKSQKTTIFEGHQKRFRYNTSMSTVSSNTVLFKLVAITSLPGMLMLAGRIHGVKAS